MTYKVCSVRMKSWGPFPQPPIPNSHACRFWGIKTRTTLTFWASISSWGLSHLQGPRSRSVLPVVPALMPEALTWAWRTGWRELLCGALPRPSSLPTLLCTESSNRPQTNSNSSQDEKRSKGPTSPLCLLCLELSQISSSPS